MRCRIVCPLNWIELNLFFCTRFHFSQTYGEWDRVKTIRKRRIEFEKRWREGVNSKYSSGFNGWKIDIRRARSLACSWFMCVRMCFSWIFVIVFAGPSCFYSYTQSFFSSLFVSSCFLRCVFISFVWCLFSHSLTQNADDTLRFI